MNIIHEFAERSENDKTLLLEALWEQHKDYGLGHFSTNRGCPCPGCRAHQRVITLSREGELPSGESGDG